MGNRKRVIVVFATGFIVGSLVAATAVSWKWRRDFENWHAMGVAGQAHVVSEIHAGRCEELADRVLESLPVYLEDMDRNHSETVSTPLVSSWVESAYAESGEPMPSGTREILDRWASTSN